MTDIVYRPSTVGYDLRYDVQGYGRFEADDVATMGFSDIAPCMESPHWEDRIRAAYLMHHLKVTMPDQFPCIFQRKDSPTNNRDGSLVFHAKDAPWEVSPDIEMLMALLPEYQAMWDSYTAKWGDRARRVFDVGYLDNVPAWGVWRPGTTADDVLRHTARVHGMPLPERLRTPR